MQYSPGHQYAHQQPLLPTPPSSPPTIGVHPVESTISLLESLVAFYHQERMWVYRTRAQLEMGLLPDFHPDAISGDAALDDDPDTPDTTSSSPPTKWLKRKKAFNLKLEGIPTRGMFPPAARGGIAKHPHPHTQHRARQSSNLNPASSSHQSTMHGPPSAALHPHPSVSATPSNPAVSFYPPSTYDAAATLTSPYLSHPSFQFPAPTNQQPHTPGMSTPRFISTTGRHAQLSAQQAPSQPGPLVLGAGGREPSVQILEMFEQMMQARMESCERVTRMVREANKPGGAAGGAGPGSVGGPVGGFGGPVGFPVGVGAQAMVGEYSGGQGGEILATQTATEEGFGANM